MPNQFENEHNVLAHYETTGPEIFTQTKGEVDIFVAGMGTTGTLMGVGKYLKEQKPGIKIVGIEPTKGHAIQGLKNMSEAIVPKIYHPELLDEKITVKDEEAFETTRLLATKEGIFVGMSSGAAVVGALQIAKKITHGTIVVILPDRGDRYLSTTLFQYNGRGGDSNSYLLVKIMVLYLLTLVGDGNVSPGLHLPPKKRLKSYRFNLDQS
jgi:cysteine synthase B